MYNVLLIDDEATVKRSLRKIIESKAAGFAVVGEAEDGEQGLRMIGELRPDMVITDIRMPVMDGLELAQALRGRGDGTELIIVSGYDHFQYAQQAMRYGVVDYLLKPLVAADVVAALHRTGDKVRRVRQHVLEINEWLIMHQRQIGQLAHAVWMLNGEKSIELLDELERRLPSSLRAADQSGSYLSPLLMTLHAQLAQLAQGQWEAVRSQAVWPEPVDRPRLERHVRDLIGIFGKMRNFGVHHLVRKAADYMEQHYFEENLSLPEIAAYVGMSPSHFSKSFKSEQGVSYTQYLTELRMKQAVRMLQDPAAKVYEVAQNVGYSDYSHFTKLFKKKYGFSPGQARSRQGRPEDQ